MKLIVEALRRTLELFDIRFGLGLLTSKCRIKHDLDVIFLSKTSA